MNNVLRVQAAQCHEQLLNDVDDLPLSEASFCDEQVVQIAHTHILHHDEVLLLALKQLNNLRDVTVVCLFEGIQLIQHEIFV